MRRKALILTLLIFVCCFYVASAAVTGNGQVVRDNHTKDGLLLFVQSLLAGLLAVFTPYVYTIHPFTSGYLTRNVKTQKQKVLNRIWYGVALIIIFTELGALISLLVHFTGLPKYTEHWIFNLFFFRIFVTLGISFLGAFAIKLPAKWINSIAKRAETNNYTGIFYMAITLPAASFSSTFPIVGLVLLMAGNAGVWGPTIGMLGFAVGLALPFVLPQMYNVLKKKSVLNNVKVVMGFVSLMIALKFLSRADIGLDLHLVDKEAFLMMWIVIWAFLGIYMLGEMKVKDDTETEQNIYGQEYVPLTRLFIAIASFVFALYLLPGMWGAPLPAIAEFLPNY